MLTLKKIAITGGISSGKTTVCRILNKHGACTLNSDQIIHKFLTDDYPCITETIDLFGSEILTDGKIDRKKIAEIVFNDVEKLKALEKILHPRLLAATADAKKPRAEPLEATLGYAQQFPVRLATSTHRPPSSGSSASCAGHPPR